MTINSLKYLLLILKLLQTNKYHKNIDQSRQEI